jgi:predicted transcriptional regulator
MIQDKLTSIRLSTNTHQFISSFAQKWNVSKSYVYRAAISEFIINQNKRKGVNQHDVI